MELFPNCAVVVDENLAQRPDRLHRSFQANLVRTLAGEGDGITRHFTVHMEFHQRTTRHVGMPLPEGIQPAVHGEVRAEVCVGSGEPHEPPILTIADRVLTAHRSDVKIVVPGVKSRDQGTPRDRLPLQKVDQPQRQVHRESFRATQIVIQGIAFRAERVNVSGNSPLGARLFEHIRVAWVKTIEPRPLVPGEEGRNKVVFQAGVGHMPPEGRTVLLAEDQHQFSGKV